MLEQAEARSPALAARHPRLEFRHGDALELPSADGAFDAVTIAFGLRNMADRVRCLARDSPGSWPGGLASSSSNSRGRGPGCGPSMISTCGASSRGGRALTGDRGAYEYLGDSIGAFPGRDALSEEIRAAGFGGVSARAMTLGVVALHVARGPRASVERLAAPAGRVRVRVPDLESLAVEPVVEVDRGAVEVLQARRIHDDRDALALEGRIVRPSARRTTSRTEGRSIRRSR